MPKYTISIMVETTIRDDDMESACGEADAIAQEIQTAMGGLHADVSDVVPDVPDEDLYEMEAG